MSEKCDAMKITNFLDLKKGLEDDLGCSIKVGVNNFQIYYKGAILSMPETIDGAFSVYHAIRTLKEEDLLK